MGNQSLRRSIFEAYLHRYEELKSRYTTTVCDRQAIIPVFLAAFGMFFSCLAGIWFVGIRESFVCQLFSRLIELSAWVYS
jgi:hypothetical protein